MPPSRPPRPRAATAIAGFDFSGRSAENRRA
jgi:hypothetical protein